MPGHVTRHPTCVGNQTITIYTSHATACSLLGILSHSKAYTVYAWIIESYANTFDGGIRYTIKLTHRDKTTQAHHIQFLQSGAFTILQFYYFLPTDTHAECVQVKSSWNYGRRSGNIKTYCGTATWKSSPLLR